MKTDSNHTIRPLYRYTFEVDDRLTGETYLTTVVASSDREAWAALTDAAPLHQWIHFTDVKPERVEVLGDE